MHWLKYFSCFYAKGVDDNGSGIAAMLEVVRQLTNGSSQGVKRKNTILFIAFDANELGKQYARY